MERSRIARAVAAALLSTALCAACERQPVDQPAAPPRAATAPAAATPEPEPAPVVATETTLAQPGVQQRDTGFDARAFAGTFEGDLPCADCPGIVERLELSPDGAFTLTDSYRERPGSGQALAGSWAVEADGTRIRLDPGSKDAADRLYAIAEDGSLAPLGADGEPTGAPGDPRLRRSR